MSKQRARMSRQRAVKVHANGVKMLDRRLAAYPAFLTPWRIRRSLASSAFSLRLLRGKKVPKADEGGERSTTDVLSRKADRQVWFYPVMQASQRWETPPHPASPPSPPQKRGGEGARLEIVAMLGTTALLTASAAPAVAAPTPDARCHRRPGARRSSRPFSTRSVRPNAAP